MTKAATTKEIPGWVEALERRKAEKASKEKTFEELTSEERNLLLKKIAIQLKMIKESPDK